MEKRLFISFSTLDDTYWPVYSQLNEEHQIYDARNLFNGEFCVSEAILQAEIFGRNIVVFNTSNFDCSDKEYLQKGFQILKGVFRFIYPLARFTISADIMFIDYESDLDPQGILDDLKLCVLR